MNFKLHSEIFDPFGDFRDGLEAVPRDSADIIDQKISDLMEEPKSGRPYKHKDGSFRNASAEGEAPGIDSGDFIDSLTVDVIEEAIVKATVLSSLEYGYVLETYHNRPFTDAAIENAMPEIDNLIDRKIDEFWER